jgi:capsular exopolysaccharide synthesis family protein
MEIGAYLTILWQRKVLVVATLVATVTVVVVGTLRATPIYEASATVRVLTAARGPVDWTGYDINYSDRLMNTDVQIATSGPVLEELVQRLGLSEPPPIQVEVVPNTELIKIVVEDADPVLARDAANALADILVARGKELYGGETRTAQETLNAQLAQIEEELTQARRDYEALIAQPAQDTERIQALARSIEVKQQTYATLLQQYQRMQLTEAMQTNALSIMEPATTPQAPSKPRKVLNVALGSMAGLLAGVGLAFLSNRLDTRLISVEQIEQATALSTLGRIPTAWRRQSPVFENGNAAQREAYRRLRTNLDALARGSRLKTLLVTSAEPGEGKSTIVASLARAVAQSGRRVIVVDADLRRPVLHRLFGLSNQAGLSSVLRQESTLEKAVQLDGIPGLYVLTSGPLVHNRAELLGSQQMTALIGSLGQSYDLVVLDTPCLLGASDGAVLAPMVDGVVLVVARARTGRAAVQSACQQLADVKARLVGVVVNRAKPDSDQRYYQYYRQNRPRSR